MKDVRRRILCLHGFSQSAVIFSKRLAAIQEECSTDCEFVFLDAPKILGKEYLDANPGWDSGDASAETPELVPRAWWLLTGTVFVGLKEAILGMRDYLAMQKVPFHGVLGFSQGAGMAAITTALLEHPETYPDFLINGSPPHPPFKISIFVSGFKVWDPSMETTFALGIQTPTLHILGKRDSIVPWARSQQLLDRCLNGRLEAHSGGHRIPSKPNWRLFFKEYLTSEDPNETVPSPEILPNISMKVEGLDTKAPPSDTRSRL